MAKKKKKVKSKFRRQLGLGIKVFVLLFLLTILVGGGILYFKYGKQIFAMQEEAIELVANSTVDTFRASESSIAYNSKGNQVAILRGEKDVYYLDFKDIPKSVLDAMIVTEDKKFFTHSGVDFLANIRAVKALIMNSGEITQGASTITQQLARDIFLTKNVNYERKIKEIFIALELEKKYNKNLILEFYINNMYYANGYYGIEAAAKGYFSKSVSELTLGQICFLSAIPNNPTIYNPVRKKENTESRKNRILDQMLADGVINRVEYDEAYNEKIVLEIKEVKTRNYIQTYIVRCATRTIMKKDGFKFKNEFDDAKMQNEYEEKYDEAYAAAQKQLFNSGYRIYTSIDLGIQKKLQKAVDTNLSMFKEKDERGIYKLQGSAVCIDNSDGRVVAIVGGRSQQTEGYTLNRAYQSYRQPGSSIKPLIVYTPSLERDYNANTIVEDKKVKDGPSNSDNRYSGSIPLHYAVEQSKNTVAWQLFDKLSPTVGLQYILNMNFARIVSNDYFLSSSLGGLTYGCSAVEMASGYATLENNGKYREPTCIIKILDTDGNTVVSDDVNEKFIYNAEAANEMVSILEGVMTKGTARGLALPNGMACAGKTGTTNDKKDGWFCGFSPYYSTAVWVGYDQPKTVDNLYGATYPGKTWHDFMSILHEDLKKKQFELKALNEKNKKEQSDSLQSSYSKTLPQQNESEKKSATPKPTKKTQKPKISPTKKPKSTPDITDDINDDTINDTSEDDGEDFNQDDTQYEEESESESEP